MVHVYRLEEGYIRYILFRASMVYPLGFSIFQVDCTNVVLSFSLSNKGQPRAPRDFTPKQQIRHDYLDVSSKNNWTSGKQRWRHLCWCASLAAECQVILLSETSCHWSLNPLLDIVLIIVRIGGGWRNSWEESVVLPRRPSYLLETDLGLS